MTPRRDPTSRAFTLLELVMVMAVIAVMFAMIGPLLGNFAAGRKPHNAATQLVAMAKYARFAAIQDGRTYRMTFDAPARSISLAVQDGSQFVETSSSLGNQIKLDENLTLRTDLTPQQNGGTYVDFHCDGRTGDGPVHVWITDKQGGVIEMACESPTELFHVLPAQETTRQ
jgi:prepilin-type N-terminal cleavage/methylation domain-containing protein